MSSLINRAACKKAVLEIAQQRRAGKFTRVSADVFDHLEGVLRSSIASLVHSHPSVGKTIMMGSKKRSKPEIEAS